MTQRLLSGFLMAVTLISTPTAMATAAPVARFASSAATMADPQTVELVGTLQWSDGTAIADATVAFSSNCQDALNTTTTDNDGHYELNNVVPTNGYMTASVAATSIRPGFVNLCGGIDATHDRTDMVTIPIDRTQVKVTNDEGGPVVGATLGFLPGSLTNAYPSVPVMFEGLAGGQSMQLPTTPPVPTDADGMTTITTVHFAGTAMVTVDTHDASAPPTQQSFVDSPDEPIVYVVPTSPVHLSGSIDWADGTPVAGATVTLHDTETCTNPTDTEPTDSTGNYTVTGNSGIHWVNIALAPTADRPGFSLCSAVDATYDRSGDHVTIPLRHTTVHVTGTDGTPVQGATLTFDPNIITDGALSFSLIGMFGRQSSSGHVYLPTTPPAPTDADGNTTVLSTWYNYPLRMRIAANDGTQGTTSQELQGDVVDDTQTFVIPTSPIHLSGSIDWADGTPVAGATVTLHDTETCTNPTDTEPTDSTGNYTVTGNSGIHWVNIALAPTADRPGFSLCSAVDATYDRSGDHVTIPLRHTTVHVTGTDGTPVQGATLTFDPNIITDGALSFSLIEMFGRQSSSGHVYLPTTPPAPTDADGNTTVLSTWYNYPLRMRIAANDGTQGTTSQELQGDVVDDTQTFVIPTSPIHLSGSIDWADGTPVAGATVTLHDTETCTNPTDTEPTDSTGNYTVTGNSGIHWVNIALAPTADRPGFSLCSAVDATYDRSGDHVTIPLRHTTVHVTGTDGTPVQGATLTFDPNIITDGALSFSLIEMFGRQSSSGHVYLPTTPPAPTDADGNTTVLSTWYNYPLRMRIAANDGSAPTTNLLLQGDVVDDTQTFPITALAGTMRDGDGMSLPDQTITMTNPDKPNDSTSTDTDENGDFGITTNPGVYDIGLGGEIGDPTTYKIKVRGVPVRGALSATRLVLPTQNINLHLVDPKGAAVAGAKISMACTSTSFRLLGQTAKGTQCASETADANGNAVLTVLPTATVKVTITPPAGSFVTGTTVQFAPSDGLAKTIVLPSLPKPTLSMTASTAGPFVTGQRITYTVTATPPTGGAVPTGSVTVAVDGVNVATKALRSGTATVPVTLPGAGTHTVTTKYSGTSPTYAPASTTTTVKIGKAATTTALTSTPTNPIAGQPITVTATVTPTAPGTGTPTGQAKVTVDGVTQPTATLTAGRATIALTGLSVGNHVVAVTYQGSDDHTRSTAATTITVTTAATRTTVTSNHPTSTTGQKVTFRVTVASTNATAGTPTGTAIVTIDGIDQPAQTLTDSTSTLITNSLGVGTHQIQVRYTGDTTHSASTSTTLVQTVTA